MIVTLDEVKTYLKIDSYDEDTELNTFIKAAGLYLKNATGQDFDSTNDLAKLFVMVLVCEWYENRDLMEAYRTSGKVRFTLSSIIAQLQYCV